MSEVREFAVDIETMRIAEMIETLPEPEVKLGNLKDEVKIAAKIKEAYEKQIAKMALSPLYGKVCSIGLYGDIKEVRTSNNEEELLEWLFCDILSSKNNSVTIVTWNGHSFDLPFLYKRELVLGETFSEKPLEYWNKRYANTPHCDLKNVWTGWSNEYVGLNEVSRVVLGKEKIDVDVGLFPEMMKTKEGRDSISEYCLYDCQLTFELYQTFKGRLFY